MKVVYFVIVFGVVLRIISENHITLNPKPLKLRFYRFSFIYMVLDFFILSNIRLRLTDRFSTYTRMYIQCSYVEC